MKIRFWMAPARFACCFSFGGFEFFTTLVSLLLSLVEILSGTVHICHFGVSRRVHWEMFISGSVLVFGWNTHLLFSCQFSCECDWEAQPPSKKMRSGVVISHHKDNPGHVPALLPEASVGTVLLRDAERCCSLNVSASYCHDNPYSSRLLSSSLFSHVQNAKLTPAQYQGETSLPLSPPRDIPMTTYKSHQLRKRANNEWCTSQS